MSKRIFLIVFFLCIQTGLMAKSFGIYGSFGGGKLNRTITSYAWFDSVNSYYLLSGGIVSDTNLSGKKVFNYRFKLGLDVMLSDAEEAKKLCRVFMSHIFAAGLYRSKRYRVWLGPEIAASYLFGESKYTNYSYLLNGYMPLSKTKKNYSMLGLHLGLVLGCNFNLTDYITISIESGIRYNIYADFKFINATSKDINGDYVVDMSDYFPMSGAEGYMSIAVLFRWGEDNVSDKRLNIRNKGKEKDLVQ